LVRQQIKKKTNQFAVLRTSRPGNENFEFKHLQQTTSLSGSAKNIGSTESLFPTKGLAQIATVCNRPPQIASLAKGA